MYLNGDYINLDRNPTENLLKIGEKYYQIDWLKEPRKYYAGGNGTVFKLIDEQEGQEFAIKFLKFPDHLWNNSRFEKRFQRFDREVEALYIAKDNGLSNIVEIQFNGKYIIDGSEFSYYVMQMCDCTLKEYLAKNTLALSQKTLLCQKILLGIIGLHEYKIYHRDIKQDNIFFIGNEPYIGDLGLADYQNSDIFIDEVGELIGPTGWFSPEALNKAMCEGPKNRNPHRFDCTIDAKSEVFQLGKLFWYIYQGNLPIGQTSLRDFMPGNATIFNILNSMLIHTKANRADPELIQSNLDEYLELH